MKVFAKFRIPETYAKEFLANNIGKSSLTKIARIVKVPVGSTVYDGIGEFDRQVKIRDGKSFFLGWELQRTYSSSELNAARLLLLKTIKTFEPAGEECGTIYDYQNHCEICGAGVRQVSELYLDLGTIPKNTSIAKTISDEIIVNQEFADILISNNMTGYKLDQVRHKDRQYKPAKSTHPKWYQLIPTSFVNIHPETKTGEDPFNTDKENKYRCKNGHTIGLDILSELSVYEKTWDGSAIVATKELFGINRGLLRTSPLLLISQGLYRLMRERGIKGYTVEVVHLIN